MVVRSKPVAHMYGDTDVTPERLNAFALASRGEQVTVLARLRAQTADNSAANKLGLLGLLVAALVVILAPLLTLDVDDRVRDNPFAVGIVVAVVVLGLLATFVPIMVDMAQDQNRRERAVVWLGAFEDELTRRHRLSGRAARRWQREH